MIENPQWIADEFGYLNLHIEGPAGEKVHALIQPRPHYCDRGHWQFNVDAPLRVNIDAGDAFPRYYMRLDVAKEEAVRWLNWRLFGIRGDSGSAANG